MYEEDLLILYEETRSYTANSWREVVCEEPLSVALLERISYPGKDLTRARIFKGIPHQYHKRQLNIESYSPKCFHKTSYYISSRLENT